MPGLYTHTTRSGSLSADQYNEDHQNHITNLIPTKVDDYSASVSEMRTTTDPGEIGTESLATTMAGEIERIRHILVEITGETYWYESPAGTIAGAQFASGTRVPFQQTAAPSGWTKDTSFTDNSAMRLTTGAVGSRTSGKGFTTAFANNYATDGTTLSSSQAGVGSHFHYMDYNLTAASGGAAPVPANYAGVNDAATSAASAAASSAHTHTVDLDVNYYDFIIASKN